MDTYEILSSVRDYSGLNSEKDLRTPLLLQYVNLGYKNVCQSLYPIFRQWLIKTVTKADQNDNEVTTPLDALKILNVWRQKTADDNDTFKLCSPVDVEDKGVIGRKNYTPDENDPIYIDEGINIQVYPSMTTLDVKIQYRKRIMDLIYGTVQSITTGTVIEFDSMAGKEDDLYNDYYLALWYESSGNIVFDNKYKITDYVGSTQKATIAGGTSLTTEVTYYALVPALPDEYHNMIVDAALVELEKSTFLKQQNKVEGNPEKYRGPLVDKINMVLTIDGLK